MGYLRLNPGSTFRCVTLDKLLSLSVPQFLHLYHGSCEADWTWPLTHGAPSRCPLPTLQVHHQMGHGIKS